MVSKLGHWIDRVIQKAVPNCFIKRLSANDTMRSGAHQSGLYIPKHVLFHCLPEIERIGKKNPSVELSANIDSHEKTAKVKAIWYNGKTRNETRITRWGGAQSPVLDPEMTGTFALFEFTGKLGNRHLNVWLCSTLEEEEQVNLALGPIEQNYFFTSFKQQKSKVVRDSSSDGREIPVTRISEMPTPIQIFNQSLNFDKDLSEYSPDNRLLMRRKIEYDLFKIAEKTHWEPQILDGFESMKDFVSVAQQILQSRRSRSGSSLERHVAKILTEEGLNEGEHFTAQPVTEKGKKPDFIFPSIAAYKDDDYEPSRLRMLAVKNTIRERWAQILEEASKIDRKHLLTLQDHVSEKQFAKISNAGIILVVPKKLQGKYPKTVKGHLMTFEEFIDEVRQL